MIVGDSREAGGAAESASRAAAAAAAESAASSLSNDEIPSSVHEDADTRALLANEASTKTPIEVIAVNGKHDPGGGGSQMGQKQVKSPVMGPVQQAMASHPPGNGVYSPGYRLESHQQLGLDGGRLSFLGMFSIVYQNSGDYEHWNII